MLALFSGTSFFVATFGLASLLLAMKKAQKINNIYQTTIAIFSIGISALVYGAEIKKPLFLLFVTALALHSHRKGWLSKRSAVVITLLPLIASKVFALPLLAMLGLSFATFRAIDVLLYSDKKMEINAIEYSNYLFFPLTLLAGPMYRWQTFRTDMATGHQKINIDSTLQGLEIILLGVAQKFLIAEAIDRFGLSNLDAHDYSVRGIALNAIFYSAFLYFDFAGYSNMAIGIGRMLGLNLPCNFNNPIASNNPQDFWRRWHISLSDWLRDVVFMPVYMKLCKTHFFASRRLFAQNIGVFLTLLVMGIWNGFTPHYVVSGLMFGSYSVAFNIMVNRSRTSAVMAWLFKNPMARLAGRFLTISLAMLALYVFSGRSPI